jgi:hypothetical protein
MIRKSYLFQKESWLMNLLAAEQRGIFTLHPPLIEKISPQRSGEFNP